MAFRRTSSIRSVKTHAPALEGFPELAVIVVKQRLLRCAAGIPFIIHPLFTFAGPSRHVCRVRSPHREVASMPLLPGQARCAARRRGPLRGKRPFVCEGHA